MTECYRCNVCGWETLDRSKPLGRCQFSTPAHPCGPMVEALRASVGHHGHRHGQTPRWGDQGYSTHTAMTVHLD